MTPQDRRSARPLVDAVVARFPPLPVADRRSPRRTQRAAASRRGLLRGAERTTTADASARKVHGDPSPVRMTQVFRAPSPWADEPWRPGLAAWVDPELGTEHGTLIVDAAAVPKWGDQRVGVARP